MGDNKDVLVVVSKLKSYVKAETGLSTSASVPAVLSEAVRILCEAAAEKAKKDGRKTLMDRDFDLSNLKSCGEEPQLQVAS